MRSARRCCAVVSRSGPMWAACPCAIGDAGIIVAARERSEARCCHQHRRCSRRPTGVRGACADRTRSFRLRADAGALAARSGSCAREAAAAEYVCRLPGPIWGAGRSGSSSRSILRACSVPPRTDWWVSALPSSVMRSCLSSPGMQVVEARNAARSGRHGSATGSAG